MAVSPADFELYSRVTGYPVPRSPQERMRMAPEVNKFIRSRGYERPEKTTLQKGADLLGRAALVGGTLAAAHAIGGGFKGQTAELVKSGAKSAGDKAASWLNANAAKYGLAGIEPGGLLEEARRENAEAAQELPSQGYYSRQSEHIADDLTQKAIDKDDFYERPSSPPPSPPPGGGGTPRTPFIPQTGGDDELIGEGSDKTYNQYVQGEDSPTSKADALVKQVQEANVVPPAEPGVQRMAGSLTTRNQNRPGLFEGLYTGLRAENPLTTGVLATAVTPDGRPIRAFGGGGGALTFPAQYQTPFQRMAYGGPFSLSTKAAMTPRFWELGGGSPPGWASGLGGTLGHMAEGAIGLVQPELIPVLGAGEAIGNFVSHIPQIAGAGASMGVRAIEQGTLAALTAAERGVTDAINLGAVAIPTAKSAGQLTRRVGDRLFDAGSNLRGIHDRRLMSPALDAARQIGQWDTEGRYYYDQVLAPKASLALAGIQRNMNALQTSADQQFNIAGKVGAASDYLLPTTRESGDVVPGRRLNDHPDLPGGEEDNAPSRAIHVAQEAYKLAGEDEPGSLTPDDKMIRTDIASKDPVNTRTWGGQRIPSRRERAEFAAGLRDRHSEWYDMTALPKGREGEGHNWVSGRRGSEGQAASLSPMQYETPMKFGDAIRNLSGESFVKGLTQPLTPKDIAEIEAAKGVGARMAQQELKNDNFEEDDDNPWYT